MVMISLFPQHRAPILLLPHLDHHTIRTKLYLSKHLNNRSWRQNKLLFRFNRTICGYVHSKTCLDSEQRSVPGFAQELLAVQNVQICCRARERPPCLGLTCESQRRKIKEFEDTAYLLHTFRKQPSNRLLHSTKQHSSFHWQFKQADLHQHYQVEERFYHGSVFRAHASI